jgi:hypothetical protein
MISFPETILTKTISHYWEENNTPSTPHPAQNRVLNMNKRQGYYLRILLIRYLPVLVKRVAQSVWRLATDWTVRDRIRGGGGGEIFRTCPDRPWGPQSLLYNGYRVFPRGVESGRGVTLIPHSLLVQRSKNRVVLYHYPLKAFVDCKMV